MSFWRSKVLVTQAPVVVLAGVPEEDVAPVSAFRDVGARAEAREQPEPDFLKR
jgi:large subunit ribosomal protein L7/L12